MLAACGVDPPAGLPGVNLLDVIAAEGKSDRDIVFGEIFEHDEPNIDDPSAGLLFRWCRQGQWKLIVPADPNAELELYDLAADSQEEKNLAGEHPDEVAALRERLDAWWTPSDGKH